MIVAIRPLFPRRSLPPLCVLLLGVLVACDPGNSAEAGPSPKVSSGHDLMTVEGVGFETPSSVLYDKAGDLYLVSNANGGPLDADGNGFISRLRPNGRLISLRWIEGGVDGVELNAPKGLAILGDTLYVADSSILFIQTSKGGSKGNIFTLVREVPTPGDLGYDERRNRILIPVLEQNRVFFVDLWR